MEHTYSQRRQDQALETKRVILATALALMREKGFDQVSVRDICKAAGITTGAFYHHFPSKQALLSQGFAPLDDYMEAALAGWEDQGPDRRLWRILEVYARFMEESGELIGRYYQLRMAHPGAGSMDASRFTLAALLDCFRQAAELGLLAPGQGPEWTAEFCYRHFRGVALDWVLHGYSYPLLPKMQEDYALFQGLFHA